MKLNKKVIWLFCGIVVLGGLVVFVVVTQLNKDDKTSPITDGLLKDYIVECVDTGNKATKEFSENVRYTLIVYECVAKSVEGSQQYKLNLELEHAVSTANASLGCGQQGKQLRADVILDSSSFDSVVLDQGYQCFDVVEEDS